MKRILFAAILISFFCHTVMAQENKASCPTISVSSPISLSEIGEPLIFTAEISKEAEKYNIEFVWTVEGGKIIEGQGTKIIKVLMEDCNKVKATLKIKGLPEKCPNEIFETFSISDGCWAQASPVRNDVVKPPEELPEIPCGLPYDSFGKLSVNSMKARLDNFLVMLSQTQNMQGFVVLRLDKKTSNAQRLLRLKEISKHLTYRKADLGQIIFVIFEEDEERTTLHIASHDAKIEDVIRLPENYKVVRGFEFDKKIKELFPKK